MVFLGHVGDVVRIVRYLALAGGDRDVVAGRVFGEFWIRRGGNQNARSLYADFEQRIGAG